MPYEFVQERLNQARTPMGTVPLSSIYGFDYPLLPLGTNTALDETDLRLSMKFGNLSDRVDNLIRTSRAMSESRLSDPYYDFCSDLSFWPRQSSVIRASTPIRARSLSPVRDVPTFRATTPVREFVSVREAPPRATSIPPLRTTSISYNSTTPWNSTGFYYSPRYPESYRGTSSTFQPYSYSRRYYDYDVFNPYRIQYFKYPRPRGNLQDVYGYAPYKFSRKNVYNILSR